MIVAVVGSRFKKIAPELKEEYKNTLIGILDRFCAKYKPKKFVSGGAEGVDSWAEEYFRNKRISREIFEPDWRPNGVYDPGAGFRRNKQIIESADFVIAFTSGSNGTKNSIEWAKRLNKSLVVFNEKGEVVESFVKEEHQ